MGVPSPSDSRLAGDPAFTPGRRSGRVGVPFASLPHSLLGTHRREPLVPVEQRHLFRCHRFRYAAMGVLFHRWKLRFSQCRFHHAPRTCGASRYIPSRLAAFPAIGWTHSAFVCFQARFLCASLRTGRTNFLVSGSPAIPRASSGVETRPLAPCLAHTAGRVPPNDLLPFAM
jgi:hypothetical protein